MNDLVYARSGFLRVPDGPARTFCPFCSERWDTALAQPDGGATFRCGAGHRWAIDRFRGQP